MTQYKCGHESNTLIMNTSIMMLASYTTWLDLNKGNKECFECYLKRERLEAKK